jgi:hypothetical protein
MMFGILSLLLSISDVNAASVSGACQFLDRRSTQIGELMGATPAEGVGIFLCNPSASSNRIPFFTFKFKDSDDRKMMDTVSSFARKVVEDHTATVFIRQDGSSHERRKWVLRVDRGPDTEPWFFYAFLSPVKAGETNLFLHYTSSPPPKRTLAQIQEQGLSLAQHGLLK